jgi:hypothetical protein
MIRFSMANEKKTGPVISPDGRYELIIEETIDRFDRFYDYILKERATKTVIFRCQGKPEAAFAANGILCIHYPGYEPTGIQIDPSSLAFRVRHDDPWVPLTAWPYVETAFNRGWAQAFDFRRQDPEMQFPLVESLLLFASVISLPALCWLPLPSIPVQLTLLLLGGAGVLFFGWLSGAGVRSWASRHKFKQNLDADRRNRPRS